MDFTIGVALAGSLSRMRSMWYCPRIGGIPSYSTWNRFFTPPGYSAVHDRSGRFLPTRLPTALTWFWLTLISRIPTTPEPTMAGSLIAKAARSFLSSFWWESRPIAAENPDFAWVGLGNFASQRISRWSRVVRRLGATLEPCHLGSLYPVTKTAAPKPAYIADCSSSPMATCVNSV